MSTAGNREKKQLLRRDIENWFATVASQLFSHSICMLDSTDAGIQWHDRMWAYDNENQSVEQGLF